MSKNSCAAAESAESAILRMARAERIYSTVTDFAKFLGLSTSHPFPTDT